MNAPLRADPVPDGTPRADGPWHERGAPTAAPPLHHIALAALADQLAAPHAADGAGAASAEAAWLRALADAARGAGLADWLRHTPAQELRLRDLSGELRLSGAEMVAVALAVAVEFDPMLARVLAWLQAPVGGARPTLGLLDSIGAALGLSGALPGLMAGVARTSGLLQFDGTPRPLPEQTLVVPLPLALLLHGQPPRAPRPGEATDLELPGWPPMRELQADPALLPPSLLQAAASQAQALRALGGAAMVVRSGHPREARLACALVAAQLGRRAVAVEGDWPAGLGPWLWLQGALPVWSVDLGPGESGRVPTIPGHRGPLLVATGPDGSVECDGDPLPSWTVPLPGPVERVRLWARHLPPEDAQQLGQAHRHGLAHIEHLARAAQLQARLDGDDAVQLQHVRSAARGGAVGELGTLAQLVADTVPDAALVAPPVLRDSLLALQQRCRVREGLAQGLGPAARTRYRSGVRALLVGPSGTGKTLAAAWLATALGLPLYRVDLAAVASKYIGETEKNLAQLFARAEHAEVVLLFDEADSLFGKRTDVKDANDRYANQQTNYLLQRIESFDGIAILTSNSRARFDSAFTRRLDMIIDFPSPGPQERRALWLAHLGAGHGLGDGELNRIAALSDLQGGHIRNAVLAAAARARGRPITGADLLEGLAAEYAKLGKPAPNGLRPTEPAVDGGPWP